MEIPSHNEETMEQQPDLTVLPPPIEHIAQAHDTEGFAAEADPAVTYNASEPTSADPGEFELYYNDPANIPDASKMPYIMMMCSNAIPDFDVKKIYPYQLVFQNRKLGGGGWIRKLTPNKEILVQEVLRREPMAKPNKSNRTVEELAMLLVPLSDPRDVEFIKAKELMFRAHLMEVLGLSEGNQKPSRRNMGGTTVVKGAPEAKPQKRMRLDDDEVELIQQKRLMKRATIEMQKEMFVTDVAMRADASVSDALTSADAVKAVTAAETLAAEKGWKVSVAIVDAKCTPILVKRSDGAYASSFDIAIGKAKTSAKFKRSSCDLEDEGRPIEEDQKSSSKQSPFVFLRGAVPIFLTERCVGAIGVSGTRDLASDEIVAKAGADAICGATTEPRSGVSEDV
eukprot:g14201.t1 g14201   contig9:1382647-1383972(+)